MRFLRQVTRPTLFILLAVWAVFAIAPLIFIVINSLKTDQEYLADPFALPSQVRWWQVVDAFTGEARSLPMARYMINTLVVTGSTVAIVLVTGAMCAYALSRHRTRGTQAAGGFVYWALAIPVSATLIPIFILTGQIGLRNNLLGLVLVYSAFWLPFVIIILKSFYDSFPRDLEDAARVDGCTEVGLFRRIILPLSVGPFVGLGVLTAIGVWSELLFALTLTTKDDVRTLTVGLAQTQVLGGAVIGTAWHSVFAGLVISITPLLVAYLVFQKRIENGLSQGGLR